MIRDSIEDDCPTNDYTPGIPSGTCESDGHYMCEECKWLDPVVISRKKFENARETDPYIKYLINLRTRLVNGSGNPSNLLRARAVGRSFRRKVFDSSFEFITDLIIDRESVLLKMYGL